MYPRLPRYSTESLRSPSPERRGGQGVRTATERTGASLAPVGQCLIALVYLIVFDASSHVTAARRKYASLAM